MTFLPPICQILLSPVPWNKVTLQGRKLYLILYKGFLVGPCEDRFLELLQRNTLGAIRRVRGYRNSGSRERSR